MRMRTASAWAIIPLALAVRKEDTSTSIPEHILEVKT